MLADDARMSVERTALLTIRWSLDFLKKKRSISIMQAVLFKIAFWDGPEWLQLVFVALMNTTKVATFLIGSLLGCLLRNAAAVPVKEAIQLFSEDRDLLSGFVAGCAAATANNPFDVVKTRQQVVAASALSSHAAGKEFAAGPTSLPAVLSELVRRDGLLGLYKGYVAKENTILPSGDEPLLTLLQGACQRSYAGEEGIPYQITHATFKAALYPDSNEVQAAVASRCPAGMAKPSDEAIEGSAQDQRTACNQATIDHQNLRHHQDNMPIILQLTRYPHPKICDQNELQWRDADAAVQDVADVDVALAVSAIRWTNVMEELLVDAPGATTLLSELSSRTRGGQQVPGVETLGDMHPKIAEMMRDGSPALLSMPTLRTAYAKFTCALCGLCSSRVNLDLPPSEYGLFDACMETCAGRGQRVAKALAAVKRCEEVGDLAGLDLACGQAIALDPTLPEPFLARGGCRLRQSRRREAQEYLKVYLVWSSQRGFHAENHSRAYWRLAECFLTELEQRNALQGALLEDRTFHALVDSTEVSLELSFRYDDDRTGLATSSAARHLLQRLEVTRSARRSAAEFLDAPVVSHVGAGRQPHDSYSVPWPMDLTAGIPDLALFSRMPTTGSSQSHRPLELLFLGSRTVLDIMATLSNLAARSTSFAHLNAECLHWKYRPKPVHIHLHTNDIARLGQALLCFMIMKQMGEQATTCFTSLPPQSPLKPLEFPTSPPPHPCLKP
ncbi:nipblb [Symbiodinium natans]|uniref:Nipblb protein n=1 Tax=Symbiodinium natans TaxID=878477 RepID=A0A812R5I0_9DINO|nr:nipblb [Symbiodinium natans]